MRSIIGFSDYEVVVSWHGYMEFYDNRRYDTKTIEAGDIKIVQRLDEPVAAYAIEEVTNNIFKYDDNVDSIFHDRISIDGPEFWNTIKELIRHFIDKHKGEWPQKPVKRFDTLETILESVFGSNRLRNGPRRFYDREGNPIDLMKLGETA